MMKKMNTSFVLLALACGILCPRANAVTSDTQLWTQAVVQGKLAGDFRFFMEAQPRFDKDISRLDRLMIRPAVGYTLNPNSTVWLGYLWNPMMHDAHTSEHRIWQQFSTEWHFTSVDLNSRSRLEERFLPGSEGSVAMRFRQLARALIPFADDKVWSFAISDEMFFNFNKVNGGPSPGFDQNRAFVGVSFKASQHLRIEPGYLMQYVNNTSPVEDRINNVIFSAFLFSL